MEVIRNLTVGHKKDQDDSIHFNNSEYKIKKPFKMKTKTVRDKEKQDLKD